MNYKRIMIDIFFICIGVLSAGFGLKGFLLPNGFIDGGAVGISLLIAELSGFSLSLLIFIVNAPFIYLGYKTLGKIFAVKTLAGIILLSLAVAVFPYPQITSDKLLVSVFGGFFLGAGIGLAVRGGGVIDGTEVLAVNLGKKLGLTIGDVILIINIIIFSTAAYLLSIEVALYSILTYLSASKTVNFIVEGIEEYTGVTIISKDYDKIRKMIIEKLRRGVTIYKGERGFIPDANIETGIDLKIIYTVITRLETNRLKAEIEEIDPMAFVVMSSVKETKGGIIKKRPLNH
ncbi:MAG: YitT family protein [Candidatus Delongbacteria bacterium]|nr:YitT family protein [Candidatus Delongbacteria bacterium]MBN2835257.1 YitT family protein [Candidatus Delongbacteria bacterium]